MHIKRSFLLITFIFFVFGLCIPHDNVAQEKVKTDSMPAEPQALKMADIPDFGNRTRTVINDVQSIANNKKVIDEISPGIKEVLNLLDNKLLQLNDTIVTFRLEGLDKAKRELALFNERITPWKRTIENIRKDCADNDSLIVSMSEVWRLTLKSLAVNATNSKSDENNKERPKSDTTAVNSPIVDLNSEVKNFITDLTTSRDSLNNYTEIIRDIQTEITFAENKLGNLTNIIESRKEKLESHIWESQYPPIWEVNKNTTQIKIRSKLKDLLNSDLSIVQSFFSNNPKLPYYTLLFFVTIFGIVIYLKANSKKLFDYFKKEPDEVNLVLKNPFLNVLVILWFILMLFSIFPKELNDVISLMMIVPLVIVLYSMNSHWKWYSVVMFIFIYFFFLIVRDIDYTFLPQRLFLISLNCFSLFLFYRIKSQKEFLKREGELWFGTLPFIVQVFIVINIVSLIANVFGSIRLAQLLIHASFGILISIYALYATVLLIQDLVFLVLMGPLVKYSNILKDDSEIILKKMGKLFRFFGFLSFLVIFLQLLGIRAETIDVAMSIINYRLKVGEMSISLGNIISFFLALQISIWLSNTIRYMLEKEVYPRSDLKAGIPNTISLIIKFSFAILGILFAFSAAGIDVGKLAILMGALGVGIGFGLQNIIANFVSGIILAIERPITIGDIIDIPGASGHVQDIGLRASTVYTWEGSHVIVPNGHLVSNKLTNWTLTNRLRRIKVEVRVPFETDMEVLSNLLLETANTIPEVMKKPKAYLNYRGIGQSAMEMDLYCWTNDSDKVFTYGTIIRKKIYKTLIEKGYDIPLPKQDLKINSEQNKKE
jgi:small-conductance mechanosensitive channel